MGNDNEDYQLEDWEQEQEEQEEFGEEDDDRRSICESLDLYY